MREDPSPGAATYECLGSPGGEVKPRAQLNTIQTKRTSASPETYTKRTSQLQPLVLPQPSQTWQDPAGRILVPQVMHSGESTAEPVMASNSSALV